MDSNIPLGPNGELPERRKDDKVMKEEVKKAVNDRLDDLEKEVSRKALTMFLISGIFLLVLMAGVGIIINVQSEQSDLAKDRAEDARNQSRIIQRERYDGYLKSCDAQNKRNRRTVAQIKKSDIPQESKNFRILLVNELQPFVKDCDSYAQGRVKE